MVMENLNLARKWRSKNFDQIIGQDLPIKMLKNSLYLNQFFPVYLFAGQRGCGKTSTARVFAAAINCERLSEFQVNPRSFWVPCLTCASCIAMSTGKHPDFIEMDAASHTGVDNVRMIVDSSSLLPLMGRKKIYLIDEAHMLSKAAFNAFLKILEEPPISVLFILATTDTQKIIETVRSRCFALYFKPIDATILHKHLQSVCMAEAITYDDEALLMIIKETGGSARDALNMLEQVRFSSSGVSRHAVQQVLGHIDDAYILELFETIVHKTPSDVLAVTHRIKLDTFSPEFIWNKLIELIRAALWMKYGIAPLHFTAYTEQLAFLLRAVSAKQLTTMLTMFYTHEQAFHKTTAQYPLLEILLLRLCQKNESNSSSGTPSLAPATMYQEVTNDEDDEQADEEDDEIPVDETDCATRWRSFVQEVERVQDPLLCSVFKQGICTSFDESSGVVTVEFAKEFSFFKDWLENAITVWKPLLHTIFGSHADLKAEFTGEKVVQAAPAKVQPMPAVIPVAKPEKAMTHTQSVSTQYRYTNTRMRSVAPAMIKEPKLDISDTTQWKTVHMLLEYFPGTVTQIKERV